MYILIMLLTAQVSLSLYLFTHIIYDIVKYAVFRNKISLLRLAVKVRFTLNDNNMMKNISLGLLVGAIIAIIVTNSIYAIMVYILIEIVSFYTMIDYNYKDR